MVYLGKTVDREFYFGAERVIKDRAKRLRNKMTPSEVILWHNLRKKKLGGTIFRRQHPIKKFIVDFYCHQARLVVEIDGGIHDHVENQEYDGNRTFELEQLGLKVIRFKNEEVEKEINKVLTTLEGIIKERTTLPKSQ